MASTAIVSNPETGGDERFFLRASIAMTLVIVAGFSLQLGMGRSTFSSPPLVHAHAIVFMGWVTIFLLQNIFAAGGSMALHRRLGWIGAGWIVAMLVLGCMVTVALVRRGQVPFFFRPRHFLIFDPAALFTFAGLTIAAIRLRRRTDWHRRLHYCAMAQLLGPGIGRLLPMPLLVPWAYEATFVGSMVFPLVGVLHDVRRGCPVHPAWRWGIATMVVSLLMVEAITYSAVGDAIYRTVAAGSPGSAIPSREFPSPPPGPLVMGAPRALLIAAAQFAPSGSQGR
ncbi:MAG TPA: hypothetical protein VNT42_05805 [Sphingomonas sp.]|nr:hypothetical protein [Sphingomonas sp.]